MPQDDRPRSVSLVFPILLILVGGLFLYASWKPAFQPWPIIRTYWPLILIFVGLGKMFDAARRRSASGESARFPIGSTIGILAFVAILVLLLWNGRHYMRAHGDWSRGSHSSETVDLQGARTVRTSINMDAGQLNISGGAAHLLESSFDFTGSWEQPRVEYHVTNGEGDLQITQQGGGPHLGHSDNTWRLNFSDAAPLDLRINMGAGQGNFRLRGVDVTRLELHLGAGEVNLDLTGPRKEDLTADIQGGVGHARIRLPKDIGVVATASGGIGSIRVHGLEKSGGEYTNAAYGKSPHTIRLNVQGGIGEIELDQEP
jgi:hypothetical protein